MPRTADPTTPTIERAAGDRAAVEAFVMTLGLDRAAAEDCAQEAVARLIAATGRGTVVRDPTAWVHRVAYNLAMDEHRRRRRLLPETALPAGGWDRAGVPVVEGVTAATVQAWLDHLPSRRRQVVHLRLVAGLDFRSIAAILDMTSSAARSHSTQALAELRRLAETGDSTSPAVAGARARSSETDARLPRIEPLGDLRPPGGFADPSGVDVDPAGRIWVVDAGRDSLVVFDGDGRYLRRWGAAGSAPGQLSFRRALGNTGDVRFAADGSFYVADNGNLRVQHFDTTGALLHCWGGPGRGRGEFLDPWSVRLDDGGLVYVSDALRGDVQVFAPDGTWLRTIGGPGRAGGRLDFQGDAQPVGDRLVVADHGNGRLSVFRLDGTFDRWLAAGALDGPDGIDVTPGGRICVADTRAGRIVLVGADGTVEASIRGNAWMLRCLPNGRLLTSGRDRVLVHRVIEPGTASLSLSI